MLTLIAAPIVRATSHVFTLIQALQRNINGRFSITVSGRLAGAKAAGCEEHVGAAITIEIVGSDTRSILRDRPKW
jgi:hypothetical protein